MSDERRGVLLVAGAALLWSMGGVGIKALADPPLKVACYRSAIAGVVLALVLRPRGARWTPSFVGAVASYAGCLITFVVATKWTSAANAIFLQYSGVVWVILLAPRVLGEPLRSRDVLAIALAFTGMSLFFVGQLGAPGSAGDATAVLSGAFYAGVVLSLRFARDAGAEAAVVWGNAVVALLLLPFVLPDPGVTARSAAILLFLGVCQLGLAYVLFVRGLRLVRATEAVLVGMLEPVANPLWVFLLLGERPRPTAILGGLVVLGAIAWRTLGTERGSALAASEETASAMRSRKPSVQG